MPLRVALTLAGDPQGWGWQLGSCHQQEGLQRALLQKGSIKSASLAVQGHRHHDMPLLPRHQGVAQASGRLHGEELAIT